MPHELGEHVSSLPLALLAVFCEATSLVAKFLLASGWGVVLFLLLHLTAAVVSGAAARRFPLPRSFVPVVAAWILFLPLWGALSLLLLVAALRFLPPPGGDLLAEFKEHVEPQVETSDSPRMAQLPLLDHLQVQPLIDLLESPDIETRRAVLEAMARRGSAPLVRCIQNCVNDPRPEIYQLAVAKLSHLQEGHGQEIARARQRYQRQPGPENGYALAATYQDYIESGLVEQAIRPVYWEQLSRLYGEIIEAAPDDHRAVLERATVNLALFANSPREDTRAAAGQQVKDDVKRSLQQRPGNPQALLRLAELSYYQRDWAALRRQLQTLVAASSKEEDPYFALSAEQRQRIEWLAGGV